MKNIVYIFCDELRQDALGCYGNPAGPMHTPNIDSIAAQGTLFENCYCNSPVCVPSRTSILTGLYPEETAVYHNEAVQPAFRMPTEVITFPQVLAQAGYSTASFGKTHIPQQLVPFQNNVREGGEMSLGLEKAELQALDKIRPHQGMPINVASLYPADRPYFPEHVTHNAIRWIQEQTAPFFVRISFLQPHTPIILKRGYEKIYQDYPFDNKLPDLSRLSEFERAFGRAGGFASLTPEEIQTAKAYYYGMVCWIDDQVGLILDALREKDLLKDTILIVNADHGALRGECCGVGKHIFHRASQAVPLIIAEPDAIQKGQRISQTVSNIDLARTILGLVGVASPEQFRGENIMVGQYPDAVYATIGYGEADSYAYPNRRHGRMSDGSGWPRRACIRTDRYRLDLNTRVNGTCPTAGNEDLFFVDTAVCPAEDRNMASLPEYAEIVTALRAKLLQHTANAKEVPPEMVRMPAKGAAE